MVGIGIGNEKDITLNGLEAIKKCKTIYLENYTSILDCTVKDLEKLYNKKIILADRNLVVGMRQLQLLSDHDNNSSAATLPMTLAIVTPPAVATKDRRNCVGSVNNDGFELTNLHGGCIDAYTPVTFGITTNELAQCLFDTELTEYENGAIEMLKELDTLFQVLGNKEYDSPKLSSKSFVLLASNKFYPIMITYENLKFSGDLNLFDDLNLRNSLSETYETFYPIERFESLDHQGIATFYENFWMPNVRFRYMGNSSENYGKEVYFENMVLSRIATITQNRDAYSNSIASLKKLKNTFAELHHNN